MHGPPASREERERRRQALRASLANPHPETVRFAEIGFAEWAGGADDRGDLVDPRGGTPVRWCPVRGWIKDASDR